MLHQGGSRKLEINQIISIVDTTTMLQNEHHNIFSTCTWMKITKWIKSLDEK
jgi:hypothetical protein